VIGMAVADEHHVAALDLLGRTAAQSLGTSMTDIVGVFAALLG